MDAKKKLVAVAGNLIHNKGFNNTSVQDILDASSVCRSNFYYHFDSKEQLGFDVLARRMEQFHAFVIAPSLENRDLGPAERVDAFLDRMLALTSMPEGELGCPFGNLAQEMSTIHEPLRKALSEFFHRGENGEISFRCDPFNNIKEPECLVKWQLLKLNQMVASYHATLEYYRKLAPMQEKMFKVMEREIDDISEADQWKVDDDDADPDDPDDESDNPWDGGKTY